MSYRATDASAFDRYTHCMPDIASVFDLMGSEFFGGVTAIFRGYALWGRALVTECELCDASHYSGFLSGILPIGLLY
jgi:hypothetical protein